MKIKDLIGETNEYDKKETLEVKEPKSWLKSVSAFANGSGGKLLFGIDDNDNIFGLSTYKEDSEKISEIIKNHMDPIPKFDLFFEPVNITNSVIVLDVEKGSETPYYFKDKNNQIAYMRVGNETVPCDKITLDALVLNGLGKTYDSIVSKYRVNDYSFDVLFKAYKIVKEQTITNSDLESFDLAQGEYLTNAGVLLADNCPLRHSRIFATRWNGLDKGQDALDSIEYEHLSLIELLNKGIEFVNKHNNKGWKKQAFGRIECISYPQRAVFEGLCNALIHRDYIEVGSEVHIDIFDDRLEIYSPGGMLEGGSIQDKDINNIKSKRRNPIIADLFGRLDYIERRGSGFKKILEDYHKYSSVVIPQFDSDKSSFVLILKNTQYSGSLPGAQPGSLPGAEAGPVPGPVTVSDIIKGKVTDKEYYVSFNAISNNRKYDEKIMLLCLKPRTRKELQELINYKSGSHMKKDILKCLIEKGYLCLINPDVPNDMNQKYYTNPKYVFKKVLDSDVIASDSNYKIFKQPGSLPGAQPGSLPGAEAGPVPGPVTVSDIIKGKVTDKEYYVSFNAISNNRKYDEKIMLLCLKPRTRKELQELINYKSGSHMKKDILKCLIEKGYLCLINPDVPNDMNQKYYTNPKYVFKKQ